MNDATVVVAFAALAAAISAAKFVLGRCALRFFQRQLELIQKPGGALRARAMAVAVQLLDL